MTLARRALGIAGEDAAAAWYEANGYEVVSRNWRCRDGELDLVVRRNRTIVFCEVKTRANDVFGSPAEAVNHVKRQKLRVLAAKWLDDSPVRPREIRFDVVSVVGTAVEVIEGAF
ncbi:MAG TPA: YraN family protein [Acidimicrobiales bacterium]|jgi:putative endonuclease